MFGRNTPWRQGHILCSDAAHAVDPQINVDQECFVVISHDCDLSSDDHIEPEVELIRAQLLHSADNNFRWAKNPRKLHLELTNSEQVVELCATNKRTIGRSVLCRFRPCTERVGIDPTSHATLKQWLAARYARSAFPDAFNEALRPAQSKLRKRLDRQKSDILAIFFDLHGDERTETPADGIYSLTIHIVYTRESNLELSSIRELQKQIRAIFESLGDNCTVYLDEVHVVMEEAFSLRQSRTLLRWNLEDLSLREPDAPIVGHEH